MSQVTTRPRCRLPRLAHLGMRQPQHMSPASINGVYAHAWLDPRALDGVDDREAGRQPPSRAEHVAFEAIDTCIACGSRR